MKKNKYYFLLFLFLTACYGSVYSSKELIQEVKKKEIKGIEITSYFKYTKLPPFPELIRFVQSNSKSLEIDSLTVSDINFIYDFIVKLANFKKSDIKLPSGFSSNGYVKDSNFFFIHINLNSELYDIIIFKYGSGNSEFGFGGGESLGFPYTVFKGNSKFSGEFISFEFAPEAIEFFNYFLDKYNKQENTDYPLVIMPEEYKMFIKNE